MRKSSPRTPRSVLGPRALARSAALVVAGGQPHAPGANGSVHPAPIVPGPGLLRPDSLGSRLRLLEGLLSRIGLADCGQYALQWLGETAGVRQSACLVRPTGERMLQAIGSYGLSSDAATGFTLSLDDSTSPLVAAIVHRRRAFFPPVRGPVDRRRRPATPLGEIGFHAVPLSAIGSGDGAFGLLLLSGEPSFPSDLEWFTAVVGQKLDQILRQQALAEGGREPGRERSLLYRFINAVTDPILLTDAEGRLVIANTRALMLFTAPEGESEGRRRAVRMNNRLLSAALSSKAIGEAGSRCDLLLVNPADGSDLLFELHSAVTEDPCQGAGVVSILRNVTDLRRASEEIEEHYRRLRVAEAQARAESDRLNLIIDSVADPIVVADAGGATSLTNAPAERLFTPPAGATDLQQRAVQANDAHFSSFIAGMLASVDERRVGEIALTDPVSGSGMPVEAIAGKILSEQGELTAVVTILHDQREAREKARLYEQLKQASSELERRIQAATADIAEQNELLRRQAIELEQASNLKSQFFANMSHEFRTPLNAILGYTSMLLHGVTGPLNDGARRQLARIESNGRHLLTIINEILDISRIEAGHMPLQMSTFRIPELVAEVRAELEPIIVRSRAALTCDLGRDLRTVTTDRQKVKQILLNLLSNALKFTHEGSIAISARRLPHERAIALAVADTGIGIAPEDQEKIFDDFRQLDNSPTRAYGGTGLGLSICRRLAQMLDGQLTVQSRPGHGSTFTLTLPVRGRR